MVRNWSVSAVSRNAIMRRAASSAMPPASKRAQIGDSGGEREREFLRFGAAGIVDDAPVGHGERAFEAAPRQVGGDHDARRALAPRRRRASVPRERAERIEAEADIDGGRRQPLPLDQGRERHRRAWLMRAEFERDGDAGVEMHAGQRRSIASGVGASP